MRRSSARSRTPARAPRSGRGSGTRSKREPTRSSPSTPTASTTRRRSRRSSPRSRRRAPELVIGRRDFGEMPPVRRLSNTLGGWVFSAAVGRRRRRTTSRATGSSADADARAPRQRRIGLRVRGRDDRALHRARSPDRPWVPIRTIYAGEPSHIRPWRHFTEFLRVSRDARRIVRGRLTDAAWLDWTTGRSQSAHLRRIAPLARRRGPGARDAGLRRAPRTGRGLADASAVTCSPWSSSPCCRDLAGGRHGDRLIPRLRLPVHRAALHLHGRRSAGVAQPAPAAGRRDRGRPIRRSRARPSRRRRSRASARRVPLFSMSFTLASRPETVSSACPSSPRCSATRRASRRVWVEVGEAIAADTAPSAERPPRIRPSIRPCGACPVTSPAEWVRVHAPARGKPSATAPTDQRSIGSRSPPENGPTGRSGCSRARNDGDPDRGRNADPGGRRRPDRWCPRARPTPARRDDGRGLATERRPEVGAAGLRLARPAHAARFDPGGRRDADGPRGRVAAPTNAERSPHPSIARPTGSTGWSRTCST